MFENRRLPKILKNEENFQKFKGIKKNIQERFNSLKIYLEEKKVQKLKVDKK